MESCLPNNLTYLTSILGYCAQPTYPLIDGFLDGLSISGMRESIRMNRWEDRPDRRPARRVLPLFLLVFLILYLGKKTCIHFFFIAQVDGMWFSDYVCTSL